ncbi:hypothetical protein [Mongoliitalea daihaiensis]|uniref:hypothetical protein n=1 Tax=Mongoliitalea daihaiensis TaxID=2782006 RepID=UPI001F2FA889|nr:hypothetical protein [Mongoliitalea daihaiensis]UJP65980.1 hypothetical protein IPZ59_04980 [Mongoliitalea daihaiensis]
MEEKSNALDKKTSTPISVDPIQGVAMEALPSKIQEVKILTKFLVSLLDKARTELYGIEMLDCCDLLEKTYIEVEANENYVEKMDLAVLFKITAKKMYALSFKLVLNKTDTEDHLELLRDGIEEIRLLFLPWIKSFESFEKYPDGWGIFED